MPESYRMRNGTVALDPRLGRLTEFDPRSRDYPAVRGTFLEAAPIRNMTWPLRGVLFDQGDTSQCVAYSAAHELVAYPAEVNPLRIDPDMLERLYWIMQKLDRYSGGEYPGADPQSRGTSVLAGCKVMVQEGWIDEFRWCFGLRDVLRALSWRGPVIVGSVWTSGMFEPDARGFVRPTGIEQGGHAYLLNRIRTSGGGYVEGPNSWGPGWGDGGYFRMRWTDLDHLLRSRGEAVLYQGRHSVAE